MRTNVGRAVRTLRRARGWRQVDVGTRAGVSREAISRLERGAVLGMTVGTVERIVRSVGAEAALTAHWRGEQLDRLIDASHASLQQATAEQLARLGWTVRVEVSFNHYGDRGRIDILAFDPRTRTLLVIEIKSAIGDLQELLGRLDVKARVGRPVARTLGWTDIAAVVPALVIRDGQAARRVVRRHSALFTRFELRGRWALAWLRRPSRAQPPSGTLWFANAQHSDSHAATAGRVRRRTKGSETRPA